MTAAAALRPGITLLVLVPLLLLARTVGSTAEALARRRARTGARRSDALRAVVASPWHLLRGTVTAVPSLLVAGSLVVLVLGAGWWLVGSGRLEAGPLRADGDAPTPAAASLLVAVAAVVGLLALWWGPVARETRTGTRWLVGGLAPGRLGVVLVLLLLAAAAALVTVLATGSVLVWEPFGAPALPGAG